MGTYSRRVLLSSGITAGIGLISGCTFLETDPPAGSLIVQNRDSFPHLVEIDLLDGPQNTVEVQSGLEGVVSIEPESEKTYEKLFSTGGTYRIRAQYESSDPIQFSVSPFSGSHGKLTIIRIEKYGNLTYVVESLDGGLL
ncbi:hypothetical protein [Haladaptatus sp. DYF46]|uniref:hypothetical protein n=1 Tax=Haladaptatus sp. DYF46 TaxID=2886041 RepID=UPI001E48127D|nr:hypothetical protein [Haladaptatus sp. DYF46]